MSEQPKCELCGFPMPEGEEMFVMHGYSGPCPGPPLPKKPTQLELVQSERDALAAEVERLREELAGFPNLSAMRQAMVDAADENATLKRTLKESTELLRVALCMPDGEAYGFVDQIAANEAVLAKGSER